MDLNRKSVKMLRELKRNGAYTSYASLERNISNFDERDLRLLIAAGFLDTLEDGAELAALPPDKILSTQYRINAQGLAHLEAKRKLWWIDFRSWAAFIISLITLALKFLG